MYREALGKLSPNKHRYTQGELEKEAQSKNRRQSKSIYECGVFWKGCVRGKSNFLQGCWIIRKLCCAENEIWIYKKHVLE